MKLPLAMATFGAAFGLVLAWARLDDPDVIHSMLRLAEPDLFLLMGSAIATAAIGVRLLRRSGARALIGGEPIRWTPMMPGRDHVLGSLLFGAGWSIACTCPGPIAVQLGRGELSALFTIAGFLGGIAVRDWARERHPSAAAEKAAPPEAAPIGL